MAFKALLSLFLWGASMVLPMLACADSSDSANIGISVVVPERLEKKRCTITLNKQIALSHLGCRYDLEAFEKAVSQQALEGSTRINSQGFVSVVITVP